MLVEQFSITKWHVKYMFVHRGLLWGITSEYVNLVIIETQSITYRACLRVTFDRVRSAWDRCLDARRDAPASRQNNDEPERQDSICSALLPPWYPDG